MSVVIEDLEGLKKQVKISISAQEMTSAYNKRLQEVAKNIKLSGFRPGKVPVKVVDMRFGKGVLEEVAVNMARDAFDALVKENKFQVAGAPRIISKDLEKNRDSLFELEFELFPEIKLKSFEGVSLEVPVCEIKDADLENTLEIMRKQHGQWEVAEKAAEKGDLITIDFEGFVDGEAFAGGKASGFDLELGAGRMIPGFEDGLMGVKAGESRKIDVTFPQEYHAADLKGKPAVFDVTVHAVKSLKLPELNDELAKKFDVDGGLEALKEQTRNSMALQMKQALENKTKEAVFAKLLELNDVTAPESLVNEEIIAMIDNTRQELKYRQGQDVPREQFSPDMFKEEATKRVLLGLLVREVIDGNKISLDQDRVEQHIDRMAQSYDDVEAAKQWYQKDEQMMNQVRSQVMEMQVVDFLVAQAELSSTVYDYSQLFER